MAAKFANSVTKFWVIRKRCATLSILNDISSETWCESHPNAQIAIMAKSANSMAKITNSVRIWERVNSAKKNHFPQK